MKFQPRNVILCDDARTEQNGKAILIGIYSGDVVAAEPTHLKVCFWIESVPQPEDMDVRFRLDIFDQNEGQKISSTMSMSVPYDPNASSNICVLNLMLPILENGYAALFSSVDGKDWDELIRKKLRITPIPSTSTVQ